MSLSRDRCNMHTPKSQSTQQDASTPLLMLAQADGREKGPPSTLTDGSMFLQTGKKNNSKESWKKSQEAS